MTNLLANDTAVLSRSLDLVANCMVCIVVAMFGFGSDLASGVDEPAVRTRHYFVGNYVRVKSQYVSELGRNIHSFKPLICLALILPVCC